MLEEECVPDRLVIIGGGVIGMEFATVYNDLGCQVTVLEAMDKILPGMDKEISQNLKMIMKKRGVDVYKRQDPGRAGSGYRFDKDRKYPQVLHAGEKRFAVPDAFSQALGNGKTGLL